MNSKQNKPQSKATILKNLTEKLFTEKNLKTKIEEENQKDNLPNYSVSFKKH